MLLDLETVLTQVWRQRKLFSVIVAAACIVSVVVAMESRPVYRSEVVVAPVNEDTLGLRGGFGGQLGGLASLAGGMLGGSRNWSEALAVLRSRHLIEELVKRENLVPILFPHKRSRLPWVSNDGPDRAPSLGDAVYLFGSSVLQVREDSKAEIATLRVQWFDPNLAAAWANELVVIADEEERVNALNDAQKSLEALQHQLETTEGVELRSAIARLIEEQLRARLVAGVRAEFQYRVIDRAVPADLNRRVQPTRTTMVLAGTLAGLLLGAMVVLGRFELARKRLAPNEGGG